MLIFFSTFLGEQISFHACT